MDARARPRTNGLGPFVGDVEAAEAEVLQVGEDEAGRRRAGGGGGGRSRGWDAAAARGVGGGGRCRGDEGGGEEVRDGVGLHVLAPTKQKVVVVMVLIQSVHQVSQAAMAHC